MGLEVSWAWGERGGLATSCVKKCLVHFPSVAGGLDALVQQCGAQLTCCAVCGLPLVYRWTCARRRRPLPPWRSACRVRATHACCLLPWTAAADRATMAVKCRGVVSQASHRYCACGTCGASLATSILFSNHLPPSLPPNHPQADAEERMLEQERAAAGGVVEVADLKTELRTAEMARQDVQVGWGAGQPGRGTGGEYWGASGDAHCRQGRWLSAPWAVQVPACGGVAAQTSNAATSCSNSHMPCPTPTPTPPTTPPPPQCSATWTPPAWRWCTSPPR